MSTFPRFAHPVFPRRTTGRLRARGNQPPRNPRHGRMRIDGETYCAGHSVPQSGIYEVLHHGDHRPSHEVVMLADHAFPACDTCGADVRFHLVRTAPYIFQDEDFEDSR